MHVLRVVDSIRIKEELYKEFHKCEEFINEELQMQDIIVPECVHNDKKAEDMLEAAYNDLEN